MKVKEVIAALENLNPELEVVVAKDDEGNGFRRVSDGWISEEKFTKDFEDMVSSEDYDEYDDLVTAVCIG